MYIPAKYQWQDREAQLELIKQWPLGTIITSGDNGIEANHIPFIVIQDGDEFRLEAHIARANPQLASLKAASECLVIFKSEDSYITPSWYETKRTTHKVVPTWDFSAVHLHGKPEIIEDPEFVFRQLNSLTYQQESQRDTPWTLDEAPVEYTSLLRKNIWGLRITITKVEGKMKLEQKMSKADVNGVVTGLKKEQGEKGHRLAEMMVKANSL